jgi:hypothetical protein
VEQGLMSPAAASSHGDASAASAGAAASLAAALAARQQQQETGAVSGAKAAEEVGVVVHMQDETGAITSYFVPHTAMQAASAAGHSSVEVANLMEQGGCLSHGAASGATEEYGGALQGHMGPAGSGRDAATQQQQGAPGLDLSSPTLKQSSAMEDQDVVMVDAEDVAADAASQQHAAGYKGCQGLGVRAEGGGCTPVRSTPVKRKMSPDVSIVAYL